MAKRRTTVWALIKPAGSTLPGRVDAVAHRPDPASPDPTAYCGVWLSDAERVRAERLGATKLCAPCSRTRSAALKPAGR
ncbi:hypothetical protein [Paractinoplanes lichenicola]|uniref:Uncharacterized protein n=1 Tax=Paractinoplanes lichenicola TaxID=2802976 RepID=A0ABS1VWD0_9ACTN|nr:hypothetical protein [Actinoplanes lichenicola]MBL7258759.1 hypothetical protein [Actinoplanes lichenicola]